MEFNILITANTVQELHDGIEMAQQYVKMFPAIFKHMEVDQDVQVDTNVSIVRTE